MIEYADPDERRRMLGKLIGIEDRVWMEAETDRVFAIADEDLDRATDDKTSRGPLPPVRVAGPDAKRPRQRAAVRLGIDHHEYRHQRTLTGDARAALIADLD